MIKFVVLQGEITCLMVASYRGNMDLVKITIELGGKELLMQSDKVSQLGYMRNKEQFNLFKSVSVLTSHRYLVDICAV